MARVLALEELVPCAVEKWSIVRDFKVFLSGKMVIRDRVRALARKETNVNIAVTVIILVLQSASALVISRPVWRFLHSGCEGFAWALSLKKH